MKLFYSPGACSIAPHILLRELELPHTLQLVSLADGEHNTASYLRINPKARVPALEIGGEIYTEVPALLTYLASLKPEAGLLPALGSVELARTLEWLAWLSSTVHIAFAQFRRPERFLPDGAETEAFTAKGRLLFEKVMDDIEARLTGTWALGDRYTIADIYILPFHLWANRIGVPTAERHPQTTAWMRRMAARPAVREAVDIEGLDWSLLGGPPE